MTPQEATDLWNEGSRRTVRQACMQQPGLFEQLKSHLSPEDYAILDERIKARQP
jgi:hypothetical protein